MNTYKMVLVGILLLFSTGCREQHPGKASAENGEKLTVFKGFPPGFEGCTCYFSLTDQDFKEEEYVFISDLEQKAFIKINGKPVTLQLAGTSRENNALDDADYTETYTNGTYTLNLTVRFGGNTGDEVWWNTGSIQLLFKGVEIDIRNFVGECGC